MDVSTEQKMELGGFKNISEESFYTENNEMGRMEISNV
jgi:hypothetical protein